MLHAGWQNDDIAGGVFFRSFLGAAHTTSFKNHNHFLSLVKMPRKYDPWAENVFMNVRLRTELFVRNEITNPCFWATRDLAKSSTQNWHARSPGYFDIAFLILIISEEMSAIATKRTLLIASAMS